MGLVEHFEKGLGQIEVGWSVDADGRRMPFQIVRFPQGSGPGTISFATLGLGRYPLTSPDPDIEIRHELLMLAPESLRDGVLPSLIQQVGEETIHSQRPLLRGDVIGPRGPLIPGSQMEALYVTLPVYFPDEFATCEEDDHTIVIAWLVPISAGEAHYIVHHGWADFEDRLVEQDPDLTDFGRQPIRLQPETELESTRQHAAGKDADK
jgi:hypothetical protein